MRLVECVPNFSEGRDKSVIQAIAAAMEAAGATVLDVDMGAAANRTVVTMAGEPEAIERAAFEAIRTAASLIDMSRHHGEHPRMGATDVCPFVPLSGVTMADCVELARRVGERVGRDLAIPVFLYDQAAACEQRRSLADIRKGEYEGLAAKLADPAWAPDFGPAAFDPRSGATVIGARQFLIAWNVDLNTRDKALASRIAIRMRETGGPARGADGERLLDPTGAPVQLPGLLPSLRAVGWVIEEYGIAQVSVNLIDYRRTPLHVAYEEARRLAADLGLAVTGSEIVGLVPKEALLEAGRWYLERQGASPGAPEPELIHVAVRSLGLSDVKPFVPAEKVIEYRLEAGRKTLADATLREFTDRVSADSAVPGGGSVAALCGSLGASLAAMVANLTFRRPDRRDARPAMRRLALRGQQLKDRLLALVTEDGASFEAVMAATRMPKGTDAEKAAREAAVERANVHAAEVPLEVTHTCAEVAELAREAAESGYENCITDAGVAAAAALAGAEGAALNVLINARSIRDAAVAGALRTGAEDATARARAGAAAALSTVRGRLT
ncbi:MAG: glutamate formimidoyltransferase [Deltaproteobacteria bacterium]|nr:glutamate formimidoyltransferase [Deltaproteobacteria bacterium]